MNPTGHCFPSCSLWPMLYPNVEGKLLDNPTPPDRIEVEPVLPTESVESVTSSSTLSDYIVAALPAHWRADLPIIQAYEGFSISLKDRGFDVETLNEKRYYWVWIGAASILALHCKMHAKLTIYEFPVDCEGNIHYKGTTYRAPDELQGKLIEDLVADYSKIDYEGNDLFDAMITPFPLDFINKIDIEKRAKKIAMPSKKDCNQLLHLIKNKNKATVLSYLKYVKAEDCGRILLSDDILQHLFFYGLEDYFIDIINELVSSRQLQHVAEILTNISPTQSVKARDLLERLILQFNDETLRAIKEAVLWAGIIINRPLVMQKALTFQPDIQKVVRKAQYVNIANFEGAGLPYALFSLLERDLPIDALTGMLDKLLSFAIDHQDPFFLKSLLAKSMKAIHKSELSRAFKFKISLNKCYVKQKPSSIGMGHLEALFHYFSKEQFYAFFTSKRFNKETDFALINSGMIDLETIDKDTEFKKSFRGSKFSWQLIRHAINQNKILTHDVVDRRMVQLINNREVLDFMFTQHRENFLKLIESFPKMCIRLWKNFIAYTEFYTSPEMKVLIPKIIELDNCLDTLIFCFHADQQATVHNIKNPFTLFKLISYIPAQSVIKCDELIECFLKAVEIKSDGKNLSPGNDCISKEIIEYFYQIDPNLVIKALESALIYSNIEWISCFFSSELICNDVVFFQSNLSMIEIVLYAYPLLDFALRLKDKLSPYFFVRLFGKELSEETIRAKLEMMFLINSLDDMRRAIELSMDNVHLQPFHSFVHNELDRLSALGGFIARSRKMFFYAGMNSYMGLECLGYPLVVKHQINYAQSRLTLTSQILESFNLIQTIKMLAKEGQFSRLVVNTVFSKRGVRTPTRGKYAFYLDFINETLTRQDGDGVVFIGEGFYLYHPRFGKDVPFTHVSYSMKGENQNYLMWYHTCPKSIRIALSYYMNLYQTLKRFDFSGTLDDFTRLLAEYYWLGAHLTLTARGNAQYVLDMARQLLKVNGLEMGPVKIDVTFPDCIALCVPMDRFINLFPTLWEFPPRFIQKIATNDPKTAAVMEGI